MDCQRIKELLLSYIDNELDADERKLVEVHLPGCAACAAEAEALAVTGSKLRQAYETVAARVSPSPAVWEAISRRVEAKQRVDKAAVISGSRWGWLFGWRHPVWRTAVAGAAILTFMIVFVMNFAPATLPLWTAAEQQAVNIATNDQTLQALLDGQGIVYEVVPVNGDVNSGLYQVGLARTVQLDNRSNVESVDIDSDSLSFSGDSVSYGSKSMVLCTETSNSWSNAIVDVRNSEVVLTQSNSTDAISDCLTAEQVQIAADIAKTDPRIGGEAIVQNVALLNEYDAELGQFGDEMVVWVRLTVDGNPYLTQVDLDEQKVVKIVDGGE